MHNFDAIKDSKTWNNKLKILKKNQQSVILDMPEKSNLCYNYSMKESSFEAPKTLKYNQS